MQASPVISILPMKYLIKSNRCEKLTTDMDFFLAETCFPHAQSPNPLNIDLHSFIV